MAEEGFYEPERRNSERDAISRVLAFLEGATSRAAIHSKSSFLGVFGLMFYMVNPIFEG